MQDLQTDRELALEAAQGNEASWKRIFEATCDRLFSLLCFQTGDRDEARDLLQETYLQAFRALPGYRGEAPLESWLRVIAVRKAIDWKRGILRRMKRTVPLGDAARSGEESMRVAPRVEARSSISERISLRRALDRLSRRQRAALLLREWEERSFREIAVVLGCNESTARVHHTRARQRMQGFLRVDTIPFGSEVRKGSSHEEPV
jgi:RNA polymerase sigma-70 factor (ECF subfamily)